MIYVMADIHGCYEEYIALLKKIDFSDDDELFVLGDVVDRGPEPIKVLQDMMMRPNVYPVLGNHDYMALKVLKKLCVVIEEDNVEDHLSADNLMDYMFWIQDGGKITADKFQKLTMEEKEDILDYLQEFTLYEVIFSGNKRFVLAHADLHGYNKSAEKSGMNLEVELKSKSEWILNSELDLQSEPDLNECLEKMDFSDFIFYRADYGKRYFEDKNTFLVTGHTPTFKIREDQQAVVYEKNGHIAVDCGCVYGGKLAVYCIDNGKVEYVDNERTVLVE